MAEKLFISDLHLAPRQPATTARFLAFLRERAVRADALYILGDLFDAWIGDDDESPPAAEVREGVRALTSCGVPVFVQHGNRDFLIGEQFLRQTGCALLPEIEVREIAGEATLLLHGDLLCTDDLDYQQARGLLRDPAFIADFLGRPLGERALLAAEYRRRSGEATSIKPEDIMDVNHQTVADYMRRHAVNRLIHGHTHRQGRHVFELDGITRERIVLGEWHPERGSVLVASPSGLEFERV